MSKIPVTNLIAVAATVALAVAAWMLIDVLLLIFAAVVLAVTLRALSQPIARRTGLHGGVALAAVVVGLVGVIGAAGWMFGAEFRDQWNELAARLPNAMERARRWLESFTAGEQLIGLVRGFEPDSGGLAERLAGFVTSAADAVLNVVLIIAGGLFLAAQPSLYRRGLLALFPGKRRERAAEALDVSGNALRMWLLGQLVAMVLVGVAVTIGLWIIGVPAPVALGLIAGLTEFIPLIGPVLGAAPALLMASSGGLEMVAWTLALFIVVQQVENTLIIPLIQRRAVSIPPAVTLFSVVAAGVLFGPLGVLLAAPLTVVIFVLVKLFYVREALGEEATLPGEGG